MDEIKEKIIAWREARKVCFAIESFDSFDKKHADKLAVSMVAWKQRGRPLGTIKDSLVACGRIDDPLKDSMTEERQKC